MDIQKVKDNVEWWSHLVEGRTALQTLRRYRPQCYKIAAELEEAARITSGIVRVTKRFVEPGNFKVFCAVEISLDSTFLWEKRKWSDRTYLSFSPTSPEGEGVEVRLEWREEELYAFLRDDPADQEPEDVRVDPNTLTAYFD